MLLQHEVIGTMPSIDIPVKMGTTLLPNLMRFLQSGTYHLHPQVLICSITLGLWVILFVESRKVRFSIRLVIFPAGGYWNSTTHSAARSRGDYWSTVWYSSSNAWYLYFNSSEVYWYYDYRRYGRSIRFSIPALKPLCDTLAHSNIRVI